MNSDERDVKMLFGVTQPGERRNLEAVTVIPEIRSMLRDLAAAFKSDNVTVIGGMLMGIYAQAYTTGGIDMMACSDEQVDCLAHKLSSDKFNRTTTHTFNHKPTSSTLRFVTPTPINSLALVQKVLKTSYIDGCGLKVACREGFIATKLQRGFMRDYGDIVEVIKIHGPVDMSEWPLTSKQYQMLNHLTAVAYQERKTV